MSSFDTMKYGLETSGIYSVSAENAIYAELKAYAAVIDIMNGYIDDLKRECFIQTAVDYGLLNVESLFGKTMDDLPIEQRRTMLINRLSITPSDYTMSDMDRILTACGLVGAKAYENFDLDVLTVTGKEHIYSDSQSEWISSQLNMLTPAHLQVLLYLNEITWRRFEQRELTWKELEALDLTWKQLDSKKESV